MLFTDFAEDDPSNGPFPLKQRRRRCRMAGSTVNLPQRERSTVSFVWKLGSTDEAFQEPPKEISWHTFVRPSKPTKPW